MSGPEFRPTWLGAGDWHPLIEVSRLNPPPRGTFLSVHGHELAVFRLVGSDEFAVVENACPHAGGNLSGGQLSGTVVECPWHQWQFDLVRGECTHNAMVRVRRYESAVREGVLYARLGAVRPAYDPSV